VVQLLELEYSGSVQDTPNSKRLRFDSENKTLKLSRSDKARPVKPWRSARPFGNGSEIRRSESPVGLAEFTHLASTCPGPEKSPGVSPALGDPASRRADEPEIRDPFDGARVGDLDRSTDRSIEEGKGNQRGKSLPPPPSYAHSRRSIFRSRDRSRRGEIKGTDAGYGRRTGQGGGKRKGKDAQRWNRSPSRG